MAIFFSRRTEIPQSNKSEQNKALSSDFGFSTSKCDDLTQKVDSFDCLVRYWTHRVVADFEILNRKMRDEKPHPISRPVLFYCFWFRELLLSVTF